MEKKSRVTKVDGTVKQDNRFSREQILESERFRDRRDILGIVLASDEQYTIDEVKELVGKYMKGKVK